ncbi:MAG: TolC family protein [Sandaracinaceae bacterium]
MRARIALVAMLSTACVGNPRSSVYETVDARIGRDVFAASRGGEATREAGSGEGVDALLRAPLDPDRAARVALLNHPDARAAVDELGIANARLLQASLLPNPELDSETRLGREGAGDEFEAHAVMNVTSLITLPLRRAAAEAELSAAQLRSADALLRMAYETRVAFIHYQAALQQRELALRFVEATRAGFEIAQGIVTAGNAPELHALMQRSLYEESRLALARAELEVLDRREALQVHMGLTGEATGWAAEETLPELPEADEDVEALEGRAIEASLQLAAFEHRLIAFARRHGVARSAGLIPELRAGVSGSVAEGILAFGPAISVTLPLFDQGIAASDEIEAELMVERDHMIAAAIAIRSMVRRADNRVRSARAQERFISETLIPVRDAVVQQTLLQYNAMGATPFQLLAARRDQIEASRALVDSRRDYWLARAALDQALAGGSVSLEPIEGARAMATGGDPSGGH